jgi:hypothetical protein
MTSYTFASTVAYFSDIEFALQLCQENFSSEAIEDYVSVQLKQACDAFRRILLLQPHPSAQSHRLTVLQAPLCLLAQMRNLIGSHLGRIMTIFCGLTRACSD